MQLKIILILVASSAMIMASAQDKGKIKVEGYTVHTDSKGKKAPVSNVNINVYKGNEKINETTSNKKGHYEVMLPFGSLYRVVFENNDDYINMSFAVDGKVPAQKENLNPSVGLDVPLFEKGTNEIDTIKFKFPFTKFKFDGNKKFVDDEKYLSDFSKGLFKEYKDALKEIKRIQAEKVVQAKQDVNTRYILVGGKLMTAGPPPAPVKNLKMNLVNEKGVVVETVRTNKFGKFSFSKLAANRNFFVKMDESDSLKLMGNNMIMYNKDGNEVMSIATNEKTGFKFQLLGSDKNTLSQLEIEDNSLLIAGSFAALLNDKSQPVAKSRVVLANPVTGEIYQTVETDAFGKFVFSKLPPDKNFIIRLEEGSAELANLKIILKDKNGNEVSKSTADGFGKFRFQFLATDIEALDNLEVDESDLKMDLQGKFLTADDKNTPLDNIKVELLDDSGGILQSTTSDGNGAFVFKDLILYKGYFIKLDETDPKINALTAIVIAEKTEKPIKEYRVDAKQGIKYRLLASDQKRLARLYIRQVAK